MSDENYESCRCFGYVLWFGSINAGVSLLQDLSDFMLTFVARGSWHMLGSLQRHGTESCKIKVITSSSLATSEI